MEGLEGLEVIEVIENIERSRGTREFRKYRLWGKQNTRSGDKEEKERVQDKEFKWVQLSKKKQDFFFTLLHPFVPLLAVASREIFQIYPNLSNLFSVGLVTICVISDISVAFLIRKEWGEEEWKSGSFCSSRQNVHSREMGQERYQMFQRDQRIQKIQVLG